MPRKPKPRKPSYIAADEGVLIIHRAMVEKLRPLFDMAEEYKKMNDGCTNR